MKVANGLLTILIFYNCCSVLICGQKSHNNGLNLNISGGGGGGIGGIGPGGDGGSVITNLNIKKIKNVRKNKGDRQKIKLANGTTLEGFNLNINGGGGGGGGGPGAGGDGGDVITNVNVGKMKNVDKIKPWKKKKDKKDKKKDKKDKKKDKETK
ncbi:adult-specific cuticular protein ACP-22-like [Mytilus trossulus]|uniref:adult-specific cuticular protein ACP-22-like n=1 Tax=Mytilus trossulus TaxID=6551 RepID=UPI003006718B